MEVEADELLRLGGAREGLGERDRLDAERAQRSARRVRHRERQGLDLEDRRRDERHEPDSA